MLAWLMSLVCGCDRTQNSTPAPAKQSVAVSDLKFPVLCIYNDISVQVKQDADELGKLHINYLTNLTTVPTLIDHDLRLYAMQNLHTTKGGMWMMANPNGTAPVVFDLTPAADSGLAPAIDALLKCKYLDVDSDEDARKRHELPRQSSFDEIVVLLRSQPSTDKTEP